VRGRLTFNVRRLTFGVRRSTFGGAGRDKQSGLPGYGHFPILLVPVVPWESRRITGEKKDEWRKRMAEVSLEEAE
jgi:hypothetical protein